MSVGRMLLNRREFVAGAAAGAAAACGWRWSQEQPATAPPDRHLGGVSLAGAEFGSHHPEFSNRNPGLHGHDYIYPSERTIAYFAEQGLGLLRLPIRWERLQPEFGKPLAPDELKRMHQVLHLAAEHGAQVILDLHNYARYQVVLSGRSRSVVIDERIAGERPVPRSALADLWQRLAEEFADSRAIAGFGLMNEPHDLGNSDWKLISQAAVTAIRSVDHEVTIFVSGDGWANAHRFEEVNGPKAWIDDPAKRARPTKRIAISTPTPPVNTAAATPRNWPTIRNWPIAVRSDWPCFCSGAARTRCAAFWANSAFRATTPAGKPSCGQRWRRCAARTWPAAIGRPVNGGTTTPCLCNHRTNIGVRRRSWRWCGKSSEAESRKRKAEHEDLDRNNAVSFQIRLSAFRFPLLPTCMLMTSAITSKQTKRQAAMIVATIMTIVYLAYRGLFTLNLAGPYAMAASLALYAAECYGGLLLLLFFFQIWDVRNPAAQPPLPGRRVDVMIPTYNEDPDLLRGTITAALKIDYPHRTYVLDDGAGRKCARCAKSWAPNTSRAKTTSTPRPAI